MQDAKNRQKIVVWAQMHSNISSTCPHNMMNFSLLAAEIVSLVWGTPADFNGFNVLASLLQRRHSTEGNQTLHNVWPLPGLVDYIYIFGDCCSVTEFCQVQNWLCVLQVLHFPVGSITARQSSSGREPNFAALSTGWQALSLNRKLQMLFAFSPFFTCLINQRNLRCGMLTKFRRLTWHSSLTIAVVATHQKSPLSCPLSETWSWFGFYSTPQCSHCKRCTSYGNSICLSVCLSAFRPSVRLSVTRRYCVKTTARTRVQFALSDSKMPLVL